MKIAIVGSGISGLVAAYLLSEEHAVTVYEADERIGGHTHTHTISRSGRKYAVDSGFIVFNPKTYPNFIKLMSRLGVEWQPSEMSFSVKCLKTGLEFRPSTLKTLFVQRRNLFKPAFYRMILDALRFRRQALELFTTDQHYAKTLDEYLREKKYSAWFKDYFILPMGSAIWSSDPQRFRQFPARYFAEFFETHGFLNIQDQPQWLVIKGGSSRYLEPLTRRFADSIRVNCGVRSIKRTRENVQIQADGLDPEAYDAVVIATHSNQALRLLQDPSEAETGILGNIGFQENDTVLHTDESVLPLRRAAWAAWNYHIPVNELGRVAVTYDMNILQDLDAAEEFCVSLNMTDAIDPHKIIKHLHYQHPVYTPKSLAARRRYAEINGQNRTYYCGAYWFYGFHEDGVKSGLAVGKLFGKKL
jgi:predicted NAD/FAD-binding protein